MSIKDYIKDKLLLTILLVVGIITIEIFLIPYPFGNFIKIYIPVAIIVLYIIGITIEFITKNNYYNNLAKTLDELDDKYLITEIIKSSSFTEGNILKNTLEQVDKSMAENVNKYKYMRRRL